MTPNEDHTGSVPAAEDPPTARLTPVAPDAPPSITAPPPAVSPPPQHPSYGGIPVPPPAPAPPRRRGRIALLLAAAALLGTVAGVTYGYRVQADEPPTALPPLSQPGLAYPKALAAGKEPDPLPAAQDHRTKTTGDLRKLLVSAPKGTKKPDFLPGEGGWVTAYEFAEDFQEPDYMFKNLVESGYRRTAVTAWSRGQGHAVIVELIQFHDQLTAGAAQYLEEQTAYLPDDDYAGNDGTAIPGSSDGLLFVFDSPDTEPGYLPLWEGRALARRGDIVMDIHFINTSKVSEKDALDLARKQLERL
ncbi:hypothetical protein SRB5_32730 [Streptomyces sp. RB5]|uniref:Uncharacterized protein n=1 Tax=Streptomyces smaragdinus TaxID=2585196 RepID=A0A7K0CJC3_9ACTN|nr:hypothetical protein [Streptomyces smaragdinus]MQY13132.1 hypothetical protein [Streptomyces smaragdinus]